MIIFLTIATLVVIILGALLFFIKQIKMSKLAQYFLVTSVGLAGCAIIWWAAMSIT
jgi:hypothetical protein